MNFSANYVYWQDNGRYWVDEYRRRQRQQPRYSLQELALTAILEANSPARVLEFGCGVGRHLSYISKIVGIEAHGADQSPTMLAGLQHWVADPEVIARTRLIEPTGPLPFADGSFDLVYTVEVLLHVAPSDIAGRVAEIARVARRAVIHIEPPADYTLSAEAHDGCWWHDLIALYAGLGITARRIGRPVEAQEVIIAAIDPSYRLAVPGAAFFWHMRDVESWLDAGAAATKEDTNRPMTANSDALPEPATKQVGSADYFPSQRQAEPVKTITDIDRQFGAPFGPVPASFRVLPKSLDPCIPLASDEELQFAYACRKSFLIQGYQEPYMNDIVRAFRLIKGKQTYLEVGTFDRGNLAYAAQLLADDAILIGVDIQQEDAHDELLRRSLKPRQTYISIVGDSRAEETVEQVRNALGYGYVLDAAFIDGGHTAHAVMCDYVNYGEIVRPGGLVLLHDSLWEGSGDYKGSADALSEIDRLDPIYLVAGEGPPHRFMRPMWRDEIWGVVGIHLRN